MDSIPKKRSIGWPLFIKFAAIIGLIASIVSIIGVIISIRSEARKLEIQIEAADQLTALPKVDGLISEFFFKDIPVVDLWRLTINFINTGDITLIGEGPSSMLLRDSILIEFPKEISILDINKKIGDFYSLTQISSNSFQLTFTQWKPKEKFEIVIYLTANKTLDELPTPLIRERSIIDGDINITYLSNQDGHQSKIALDYLPPLISFIGRIFGILFTLTTSGIIGYFLIIDIPQRYLKVLSWKRKYFDILENSIKNLNLSVKEYNEILKDPTLLKYPNISFSINTIKKLHSIGLLDENYIKSIPGDSAISSLSSFFLYIFIGLFILAIGCTIISGLIKI